MGGPSSLDGDVAMSSSDTADQGDRLQVSVDVHMSMDVCGCYCSVGGEMRNSSVALAVVQNKMSSLCDSSISLVVQRARG